MPKHHKRHGSRKRRPKVVVIAGSAGGLQALSTIVPVLPPSLPAALAVVIHSPAEGEGYLPRILSRLTSIPVTYCTDGEPIRPGRIVVAPPDSHLLVDHDRYRLSDGPRENGFRPAADPLFRSAAEYFGADAIGVILSGALDDGAHGLAVIKERGGVAISQHPNDAAVPGMPQSAIAYVEVDHVATAGELGPLIVEACEGTGSRGVSMNPRRRKRPAIAEGESMTIPEMIDRHGLASGLTCPDCGGALWEITEGRLTRYQCHVGHKYSPASLDQEQWRAAEEAVWSAIRLFEEHSDLRRRLGRQASENGLQAVATGYRETAARSARHAMALQRLVASNVTQSAELRRAPRARRARSKPVSSQG